jgi:hypothetical protein
MSFDEAPAGQAKEHVLQGRTADETRHRVVTAFSDFCQIAFTVIAIDQDSVGQYFLTLANIRY